MFRKAHKEILNIERGNGLWLWKPYIIMKTLEAVIEGDYVFYCDSGAFFFSSVMPLIQSMGDSDVWVSDIHMMEEQWTKPEVFRQLGIEYRQDIKNSRQIQGTVVLVRKSEQSLKFIREWLELCVRPELIMPLQPREYRGKCIEHREDQSLLSVLSKIYRIEAHTIPFIGPVHPQTDSFIRLAKNILKPIFRRTPLLRRLIKPKRPFYPEAIRIPDVYTEQICPCIYIHRIRQAKNMYSLLFQLVTGMGFFRGLKILCVCLKSVTSRIGGLHEYT